jgi:hypothetical protein
MTRANSHSHLFVENKSTHLLAHDFAPNVPLPRDAQLKTQLSVGILNPIPCHFEQENMDYKE